MTQTALILPLEPVDKSVEAFRNIHDPAAKLGVPPHITLIYPFVPLEDFDASQESKLVDLLLGFDPFSYELDQVSAFEETAHLLPSAPEPFLALIRSLTSTFPTYLPYGGKFERIVPHLTIGDQKCVEKAREKIYLPVRAIANRALLLRQEGMGWMTQRYFEFGGADAANG